MMQSKYDILKAGVDQRNEEIFGYQINIDNYTALIEMLPKEWPENLIQYKNAAPETQVDLSMEDIMLMADLAFREKLEVALLTEKIEQRKAIQIQQVMKNQLEK